MGHQPLHVLEFSAAFLADQGLIGFGLAFMTP
jgi:hypothetical protein